VRFDGSLLTIADDLGHLRAYQPHVASKYET
jgi:hypothetical protein